MKICTKCNKKWQDEFNFCPECSGELVFDAPKVKPSVSMGDGNAINGGVHISEDLSTKDDHSTSASNNVTNSNNTTTNTTNNTQNIYNAPITQIEREKTKEEILHERSLKYRECCKKVLADGIITQEEKIWLEEQRVFHGLSAEIASHILSEVSNSYQRSVMSMGTVQRIQFNNLKKAVDGNIIVNIKKVMPQIKVIASKFQEEELQYMYHMVLAALYPEECVNVYANRQEDKYWLTFWVYVALHKLGDISNAENAMIDLGKWQGLMPDENLVVLAALGSLIDGDKETASEMFIQAVTGEHSQLLTNIAEVISAIINYNPEDSDIKVLLTQNKFYYENFLSRSIENEINAARIAAEKEEAERKRQQEEEERRRQEEERKKKEEEERRKREEEAKRKAEEEARKKAEEERKRKEEEARRKAEEDARRKAEEARKKIEEERKQLEEVKKKIEAERKALEEEQKRKAAEEAERKRLQEEELRRKEMERQAMESCKKLVEKYLLKETPFLDLRSADVAKTIKGLTYLRTPEILFMYAVCTEQGYYGRTNKEVLTQLYLEAAQAGEPLGYVCLANLYSTGEHGFTINSKTAMSYYEKCLTTNRRMQALTHMAIAYSRAYQDLQTAKKYLEEAIKLGSNVAGKYLKEVQKKIDDQNIQLERERKAKEAEQKRKEREEEERRRKLAETIAATAASDILRKHEEANKNTTKKCPYCGKEIAADATFCKYCGRKINAEHEDTKTNSGTNKKWCRKCGFELKPTAKFCPKCGTKV